jgi:hypothetical protein
MIVMAIDERDVDGCVTQPADHVQTRKARPHDDDMWPAANLARAVVPEAGPLPVAARGWTGVPVGFGSVRQ